MRARWVAALALALAVAGCGGGEVPPTTPTSPPTPTSSSGGGGAAGASGVVVQERAFAAGGGSGIVASKRYPGVLWAIRDRGGQDRPGRPQNALYAYKVTDGRVGKVAGAPFKAVPMPIPARDWEDIGRDSDGNLWIADIGNNECDRTDTALHKVREPDPAAAEPAELVATYRYRFPDPPPGCAGRNAEAMFLVDDVPYLIDKAERSTLYRFPSLDPDGAVTLEKVGVLAGQVANLSGADLSSDRSRLAVDTHTVLYVYQASDPSLDGPALVADLIGRPPAWTVQLAGRGAGAANVEGVAFGYGSLDLNLLAENRDVYFVPAAAYER
ncbi:MAG TPA: hypothetical protein VFX88_22975 [Actinomycetota bacterium]|nr:hypothetical protein [Actinomycetota bacterium]